jgi:hypothetical protein
LWGVGNDLFVFVNVGSDLFYMFWPEIAVFIIGEFYVRDFQKNYSAKKRTPVSVEFGNCFIGCKETFSYHFLFFLKLHSIQLFQMYQFNERLSMKNC